METTSYNLFEEAVREKIFPGACMGVAVGASDRRQSVVRCYGNTSFFPGQKKVEENTLYDLASLTKPLATTLALLCLMKEKKIKLSDRLSSFFGNGLPSDKASLTVGNLLSHSAGLVAYLPFFETLFTLAPEKRKERMVEMIFSEPLSCAPGQKSTYSDLGFILLGEIIERVAAIPLPQYVREKVFKPLQLEEDVFFMSAEETGIRRERFAAAEECRVRGSILQGEVSDENAYALGGAAGHAGLFGTIHGVLSLAVHILDQWKGRTQHPNIDSDDLRLFLTRQNIPGSTWALGFDTPSATGSTGGRYISQTSVGHLGFTGTSFWIDPVRELVMVLLSNRVHPSRENDRIKEFRPLFHDMVIEQLGLV